MTGTELLTALKLARTSTMFFVFIPGKGPDGHLIVTRLPIPRQQISAAKKESGGRPVVTGTLFGSTSDLVFQVDRELAGLAKMLAKVIKRDAGVTVRINVQLASDADLAPWRLAG